MAWIPRDVQKAKAFMQHNLAVCHATRTEYDKANKFLTEVSVRNTVEPVTGTEYDK